MYGVGGSPAISRDQNLSFSSNSKHSDGEFVKGREFVSSDLSQHQQNQHHSSGLTRYRSAPSSFFASLVDGGCDDFLSPYQSSSPESEVMFSRFVSSNCSGDSEPQNLQFPTAIKHEMQEQNQFPNSTSTQMIYQTSLDHRDLENRSDSVSTQTNLDRLCKVPNVASMENPAPGKTSSGNCSNLIRQSSSPAGLFSNLSVENGFTVTRGDVGNFRVDNGTNGKGSPTKRLNGHISFSSGPSCSRFMPQICESSSPENGHLGNNSNGFYLSSSQNDSWSDSDFTGLKRNRDAEEKCSGFHSLESQVPFADPMLVSQFSWRSLQTVHFYTA
ncbi:hypothetical protein U1Q18_051169 [Sarracenia purpurea var. burkii]